eukprot:CAMPEP_0176425678 /NCGR_PEP_ID=MMETSP0127-20121128/11518_1 /TAXON_ID=938130 /ORGANISM="Platyophrya macrostoma, Strain WH" /LENGTH=240 /DNA_ID=CAMNT_0017806857 /DNA_START=224 /DNA_END=946 /DNA_ORIENTATION=-
MGPSVSMRFCAAATASAAGAGAGTSGATAADAKAEDPKGTQGKEGEQQQKFQSTALGQADENASGKKRNIVVMSNTTKAVYIHRQNHIASWYWFITDFHKWFVGFMVLFVGSQILARYRIAKMQTAVQAQLGENLLDQRTRDLLSDIEQLRAKDPLRLENEANAYHEQFWCRRAKSASERNQERRNVEITRGMMQGEARGTDMTEWLGAKAKDDQEREVARRTQEYIQGFHQHLKSRRLI